MLDTNSNASVEVFKQALQALLVAKENEVESFAAVPRCKGAAEPLGAVFVVGNPKKAMELEAAYIALTKKWDEEDGAVDRHEVTVRVPLKKEPTQTKRRRMTDAHKQEEQQRVLINFQYDTLDFAQAQALFSALEDAPRVLGVKRLGLDGCLPPGFEYVVTLSRHLSDEEVTALEEAKGINCIVAPYPWRPKES